MLAALREAALREAARCGEHFGGLVDEALAGAGPKRWGKAWEKCGKCGENYGKTLGKNYGEKSWSDWTSRLICQHFFTMGQNRGLNP